jgi:hypothetical protein
MNRVSSIVAVVLNMLEKIKLWLIRFSASLAAKIFAGLIVFYFLFAYFAINPLAQQLVPWLAEEKLASKASVGKVTFDPLRLKTTIDEFALTEKNGTPLASFEKLVLDLELSGIFKWAWKLKEINILAPKANITITNQGKLNWADLIAKLNEDKTPPSDDIPRVIVEHFAMSRGHIEYLEENRPTPLKAALSSLDFELGGFSTLPQDRGDYLIAAKLPHHGGTLKWKGNLGVNPVASKGAVAIENIRIAKLLEMIKTDSPPFKAASGEMHSEFQYDFSLVNDQPKLLLNELKFALHEVSGELNQVGKISLNHAEITTPFLSLTMQKDVNLTLKETQLTLEKLNLNKESTAFSLEKFQASLPQLNVLRGENTQVAFEHFNLNFANLALKNADHTLLELPTLQANEISLDLANRKAEVAQLMLPKGKITLVRDKNGDINWQQAFAASTPHEKIASAENASSSEVTNHHTAQPFSFAIQNIALDHWQINFLDHTFVRPLSANIADFNLAFAVEAPEGKLSVNKIAANLNKLTVDSENKSVANLEKLSLNQAEIALDAKKVNVDSILLSGLKTAVLKEANQPLNWQKILETATTSTTQSANTQNASARKKPNEKSDWSVGLKKFALTNGNVHVEDKTNATPVVLDVEQINVEAKDASLDLKRAIPVKAAFKVKQGGAFNAQGKLTPAPLKADLQLKLADFSFVPFAPYVNQFAMLKLSAGAANVQGKLHVTSPEKIAFDGGFSVNKLLLVEETSGAAFMGWEKLSSESLALNLNPNRLHMNELNIVKPVGKFIIHEDKTMNVTRILRQPPTSANAENKESTPEKPAEEPKEKSAEATPQETGGNSLIKNNIAATEAEKLVEMTPPPVESAAPEEFPIAIETVRIDNAALEFADLSLTPQFGTNIHSLSGVINGVSTNASSVAQVELDGKVDDYGAARIRGSVQPFKATNFTNLKLSFANLEMNRLTPYSGKFAGRKIESGKLSVDLEYKIKQRKLAGENKFIINKLKLGERVESKDAADLPLDLAIAILEDNDGLIDLDLPISGSLDDPKFSYGSIVWKAIRNVLSKIVTAPFRALGKLFGGSSDKLEAITFEAGNSKLMPPEMEKLKAVSEALSKRQGLSLKITPVYDVAPDTRAIQEVTLRKKVAEEMGIQLAEGQAPGPIDLTNPKVQKAIDSLFDDLTKKGLLKRLASKLEKPKEGHFEEAQEKLTVSIEVTEADLQKLAQARGDAIQQALVDSGITKERLSLNAPEKVQGDGKTINTKLNVDVKSTKAAEPTASTDKPL